LAETSRGNDCVFISYKIKEVSFTATELYQPHKVCLLSKNLTNDKRLILNFISCHVFFRKILVYLPFIDWKTRTFPRMTAHTGVFLDPSSMWNPRGLEYLPWPTFINKNRNTQYEFHTWSQD
jgi:hypothetical protein